MEPTERFDWQGREIAWGRSGSGPAVVFCHGTPFSSLLWQPFADALSSDFTVYLWDMPGYGRSSKHADHPVDFGVQAKALAALLQHWDVQPPHVVAHDFGGAVSLRAHLSGGVPYASLLLLDVVAIPPTGSPLFRFVQEHPDVLGRLPGYVHRAIVRAYIPTASHRGLREDVLDALVEPWTGEIGQPALYRQMADFDERFLVEIEERLPQIDIPVRVLWGADDVWIPLDIARKITASIPGATLELIDGAGHLVHYDAPVALMNQLRVWLSQVS